MERKEIQQIIEIVEGNLTDEEIREKLDNYHESDLADAIEQLSTASRLKLYHILGVEKVSEIFAYLEDSSSYLKELSLQQAASVLEHMDSDDAVDVLENIDDSDMREHLLSLMDQASSEDIRLIRSYEEDEMGSRMTTNFVTIPKDATIKQAMRALVQQAHENDNINTLYVTDKDNNYCGAVDLRDLIIVRETTPLDSIVSVNYPFVLATDSVSGMIEDLKDYAEDSIPVLDENHHLLGIITSQDLVEAVDDAMGEDYAKLAGLTAEEDLHEKLFDSMRKRIPWLVLLLFLGMGVSSVIGAFESIVSQMAILICFQSLILDMAGNVGTQSLAVTIRVLMDENASGKEIFEFVLKELQIGAANGLFLGSLAFVFVTFYLHLLKGYTWFGGIQIATCVGLSLLIAMIISSLIGTLTPMFFHKIKVDPAAASGPLITTINDLVSVLSYYGIVELMLIHK